MSRHLQSCHRHESDVKRTLSYEVKSAKRRLIYENIMYAGDYYHNIEVLNTGRGELIVLRRPSASEPATQNVNPKSYMPCPECLGFVKWKNLWRHAKKCKEVKKTDRN